MKNLIWEGMEKAFQFWVSFAVAKAVYIVVRDMAAKEQKNLSWWRVSLFLIGIVVSLFFAALALSGLIDEPGNVMITTYAFVLMLSAALYGLFDTFKNQNK